jgi:hypothetical protein
MLYKKQHIDPPTRQWVTSPSTGNDVTSLPFDRARLRSVVDWIVFNTTIGITGFVFCRVGTSINDIDGARVRYLEQCSGI